MRKNSSGIAAKAFACILLSLGMPTAAYANVVGIEVERVETTEDGEHTKVYFRATNISDETLERILVRCEFTDPSGHFLDYASTYVYGLLRGATRSSYVSGWTKFRYGSVKCVAQ